MATETEKPKEKKKRKWKKKLIFRKSSEMDDVHLLENSGVWQALLVENQVDFTAFDNDFALPYATDWLGKIRAMENFDTDETMEDDIEERLRLFRVEMKALMGQVTDLEYYAKKAFPDDERTLHLFGFVVTRAAAAKESAGKTALLCFTMTKIAGDFNTELTNAGMPAGLPAAINGQKDAISEAWCNVDYGRRLRYLAATKRVKMFNELWDIHVKVRDAAAVIFKNDVELAKQFE